MPSHSLHDLLLFVSSGLISFLLLTHVLKVLLLCLCLSLLLSPLFFHLLLEVGSLLLFNLGHARLKHLLQKLLVFLCLLVQLFLFDSQGFRLLLDQLSDPL